MLDRGGQQAERVLGPAEPVQRVPASLLDAGLLEERERALVAALRLGGPVRDELETAGCSLRCMLAKIF